MKNRSVQFMGMALSAMILFSCASGNKYGKLSYGGGWADAKATAATTPAPPATVNTNESVSLPAPVSAVETPVSRIPEVSRVSTPASVSGASEMVSVNSPAKEVKHKTSVKQKIANRVAKKVLSSKKANEIDNKLVLVIIAIFLPWLAVLLYEGEITLNFWLSLLLWFLFWIPGFIYALLVIFDVI